MSARKPARGFIRKITGLIIFSFFVVFFAVTADSRKDVLPDGATGVVLEADRLYAAAVEAAAGGDLPLARENFEKIMRGHPRFSRMAEARSQWGEVVWKMIHSGDPGPESMVYTVAPGDTLGKIARAHGTLVELIKIRNRLKSDKIRVNQKLSIFVKPLTVRVDKAANRLFVELDGKVIRSYSVSTGKPETPTPEGEFVIRDRLTEPTWFWQGKVFAPGDPENELGTRWLGFDKPSYGIHGTIYPEKIGRSVSSGCVRMRNQDVEELYNVLPSGTKVTISGGASR
jgi:hypothetical protein